MPGIGRRPDIGCKYGVDVGPGLRGGGTPVGQSWCDRPPPPARRPKGVLAGPGTRMDPKSHLFVTNWVHIQPFWSLLAREFAEFPRGGHWGGSRPLNLNFFFTILEPKMSKSKFMGFFLKMDCPSQGGFGSKGA